MPRRRDLAGGRCLRVEAHTSHRTPRSPRSAWRRPPRCAGRGGRHVAAGRSNSSARWACFDERDQQPPGRARSRPRAPWRPAGSRFRSWNGRAAARAESRARRGRAGRRWRVPRRRRRQRQRSAARRGAGPGADAASGTPEAAGETRRPYRTTRPAGIREPGAVSGAPADSQPQTCVAAAVLADGLVSPAVAGLAAGTPRSPAGAPRRPVVLGVALGVALTTPSSSWSWSWS